MATLTDITDQDSGVASSEATPESQNLSPCTQEKAVKEEEGGTSSAEKKSGDGDDAVVTTTSSNTLATNELDDDDDDDEVNHQPKGGIRLKSMEKNKQTALGPESSAS